MSTVFSQPSVQAFSGFTVGNIARGYPLGPLFIIFLHAREAKWKPETGEREPKGVKDHGQSLPRATGGLLLSTLAALADSAPKLARALPPC